MLFECVGKTLAKAMKGSWWISCLQPSLSTWDACNTLVCCYHCFAIQYKQLSVLLTVHIHQQCLILIVYWTIQSFMINKRSSRWLSYRSWPHSSITSFLCAFGRSTAHLFGTCCPFSMTWHQLAVHSTSWQYAQDLGTQAPWVAKTLKKNNKYYHPTRGGYRKPVKQGVKR